MIRLEGGSRIEAVRRRLTAIERLAGLTPDVPDIDAELDRLWRDMDAAIDAKDFRLAEALSDAETDLLVNRDRRAAELAERPSLLMQIAQLRAEVERLRAVLRAHGLDAG
jgi:hypothetical protein